MQWRDSLQSSLCLNLKEVCYAASFFPFLFLLLLLRCQKKISRQSARTQNANVNIKFNSKRKVGYKVVVAQLWDFPAATTVFSSHVLNERKYSKTIIKSCFVLFFFLIISAWSPTSLQHFNLWKSNEIKCSCSKLNLLDCWLLLACLCH